MAPVIGITSQRRDVATSYGAQPANTVTLSYSDSVVGAGGVPIVLPILDPEAVPYALRRLDGVVLTGGGDISPDAYGGEGHPAVYGVHEERDRSELAVARYAAEHKMPVLAICRGTQIMNVALGGDLIADIPSQVEGGLEHFVTGNGAAKEAHQPVALAEDCGLARLFGTTSLKVNSLHHQAVRTPAPGLRPVAWGEDGVVEALEAEDSSWPLLAVQWHPENLVGTESAARTLFDELIKAASVHALNR
ncbi:MAG: gamma-glutamyl-gamma-aminobutyrate hydrolase family protein [Acidimicrobiia bacterium]|nr:gamma-glutamyl-gamma-aminobutyrate hydrolase family protein [Acidimicrobiia bacterium]NNJ48412.1 gamma-glutamyl-gamma-aminobutyrate hydrolase family protein [Acidimicrobiia bacterium]NNL98218.1 gamma-glutamyl-gamma-aminobutyrate hydrolase family protein [Acidimicrobiia bacterium]